MGIELILLGVIAIVVVTDFVLKRQKNKTSSESLVDKIEGNTEAKKNKTKKLILTSLSIILIIPVLYYINTNWQTISDKVLFEKPIKIEYSGPDVSLYNTIVFTRIRKKINDRLWFVTNHIDSHIYSSVFTMNDHYMHKEHIWGNVHFITNTTIFKGEVFGNSILEFNDKNKLVKIESSHIQYEYPADKSLTPSSIYTIEYDENDRIKSSKFLRDAWEEIFIHNHIFNDEDQLIETSSMQYTIIDYENKIDGALTNFYYKYNDKIFLSSIITKKSSSNYLDIKIVHNDNNGNVIVHHSSRDECDLCDPIKTNSNELVGESGFNYEYFNYYTYNQYDNLIKSTSEYKPSDNYPDVFFLSYNYTKYDKNNNWLSREITIDQDSLNKIIQTRKIIYY